MFTGKNNFGLWLLKMRAMLIQQGLLAALEGDKEKEKDKAPIDPDEKAIAKRAEIMAKAHNVVVLCLGDKVLREVAKETTAARILGKLETVSVYDEVTRQPAAEATALFVQVHGG